MLAADSKAEKNNSKNADASEKPTSKKMLWFKRGLTTFFFIAVPILLFMLLKEVDWQEVQQALRDIKPTTLALGLLIAFLSYMIYGCFDLLGRKYSGHKLPALQVMPVACVCYAFTMNLSYIVGGFALRFRLYSRLGLDTPTITKVFTLSIITNWLGYMVLAGSIFSMRLVTLPDGWKLGTTGLQVIGFVLLVVSAGYMLACAFAKRRSWNFFKHDVELPSINVALMQVVLACINWCLMALIIWIFLPEKISYFTTLGLLLVSAIAGVIAHIPGGLGVLEGIFITVLQHQISHGAILAALIGYRVCYFLAPLAVSFVTYLILESRAKNMRSHNDSEPSQAST